jgi:NADH-quinone oxidoreductase subunit C
MADNEQAAAPVAPPMPDIRAELAKIRTASPDAILAVEEHPERDMFWITVPTRFLVSVAKLLRDDKALDYKMLADLTCVDRPEQERRLNVIYNFYSVSRNRRLFLRVFVADGEPVPTLSALYPAANWAEREVYDLFGVVFEGHPGLTRIMMPDDWDGYPLRKDYPIVGKRPVILYNDVKDVF